MRALVSLRGQDLPFPASFACYSSLLSCIGRTFCPRRWLLTQELKRKLPAILSADVKGYSRLMGEDEELTARTLDTFNGVMKNIIFQNRGRAVHSTGDIPLLFRAKWRARVSPAGCYIINLKDAVP